jgi:hypothetical protein
MGTKPGIYGLRSCSPVYSLNKKTLGAVEQNYVLGNASIIDQDIYLAELLKGSRYQVVYIGLVGHVSPDG